MATFRAAALAAVVGALAAPTVAHAGVLDAVTAPFKSIAAAVSPKPQLPPNGSDLIYVLSDTHISEGVRPDGKMSPLEDFTVDAEFQGFMSHALTSAGKVKRAKLILAGDIFDFLKVVTPPAGEAWPTTGPMANRTERDVAPTEAVAILKMRRILDAHPQVVAALRAWVEAGHEIVLIAGNHDQEMHYSQVRRVLRQAIGPAARGRVKFSPGGHIDGDLLAEHGQRYDEMNSVSSMLYPFDSRGANRRLRPAAGNFMVVEMNNPLKLNAPRVNQAGSGGDMVKIAMRDAPRTTLGVVPFAGRMSQRTGERAPTRANPRSQRLHARLAVYGPWVDEIMPMVNATRASRGQRKLTRDELIDLAVEWDELAVKPYLEGKAVGTGPWRGAFEMLRPREFKKWLAAANAHGSMPGEELALDKLVNIYVSGHTHEAHAEETSPLGERGRDALRRRLGMRVRDRQARYAFNAGTWTPTLDATGRPDSHGTLTFVEVARKGGRSVPRLMRWDATRNSAVVHAKPTARH